MTESGGPLGRFLREQRALASLSVREMARMAQVSNAYLSQVERGMHAPSLRVMRALADALEVPVEEMLGAPQRQRRAASLVANAVLERRRGGDQVRPTTDRGPQAGSARGVSQLCRHANRRVTDRSGQT